MVLIDNVKTI